MDDCRCTKESDIAQLQANQKINIDEVRNLRTEMADLKNIYKLIYELTSNFSVLNETMNHTRDDVACIKQDLETIKRRPNERQEHYVKAIVTAIILLIVGALLKGVIL